MACNFIMDNNGAVRMTSFSSKETYDVGEIHFYVPVNCAENKQIFLVLKNTYNFYEIIELDLMKRINNNSNNLLYKTTLNNEIKKIDGMVDVFLLLIDKKSGVLQLSESCKMNISTEKYSIARQIYIVQQLNNNIADYYLKIVNMTDKNKEIYEKIQKGAINYENSHEC